MHFYVVTILSGSPCPAGTGASREGAGRAGTTEQCQTASKTEGKGSAPEVSALSPGMKKLERQTLAFVKVTEAFHLHGT